MTDLPDPPGGRLDGHVHRYPLRVFYEDTDAGGVVYHANYLRWMERARSDLVALLGIDQRAALESGDGLYTVAELSIRYLAPARLGDAVVVETVAGTVGRASCTLEQRMRRGATLLASSQVRIGFVAPDGRPRRQPDAWREAFLALVPPTAVEPDPAPVSCPEGQE